MKRRTGIVLTGLLLIGVLIFTGCRRRETAIDPSEQESGSRVEETAAEDTAEPDESTDKESGSTKEKEDKSSGEKEKKSSEKTTAEEKTEAASEEKTEAASETTAAEASDPESEESGTPLNEKAIQGGKRTESASEEKTETSASTEGTTPASQENEAEGAPAASESTTAAPSEASTTAASKTTEASTQSSAENASKSEPAAPEESASAPEEPVQEPPAQAPAAAGYNTEMAQAIFNKMNEYRQNAGLPAMAVDGAVQQAAEYRAAQLSSDLSSSQEKLRAALSQSGVPQYAAAECMVYAGPPASYFTAESIYETWRGSLDSQCLQPNLAGVGIAIYVANDTIYGDAIFAINGAAAAPPTAPQETVPETSAAPYFDAGRAQECFQKVNELRASLGLSQLSWDPVAAQVAEARAPQLIADFSHNQFQGVISQYRDPAGCGENILYCSPAAYYTGTDMYQMWHDSPGHYANMVTPGYTGIGIAAYVQDGTLYGVQIFTTN